MKRSHDSLFGLGRKQIIGNKLFSFFAERNEWNEILKMSTKQCKNWKANVPLAETIFWEYCCLVSSTSIGGMVMKARGELSRLASIYINILYNPMNTTNIDYTIGYIFPRGFQFIFCLYFKFLDTKESKIYGRNIIVSYLYSLVVNLWMNEWKGACLIHARMDEH